MSAGHAPESPEVRERTGPSVVWLIPLLTALVGVWLVFTTLAEKGPVAELQFKTAEGIEIGKTKIKYKSVDIGVVEDVRFAEDFENVLLTVQFNPGTEHFLRRNTRFWVVKPQLSVRGVSGLSTLVSGSYIEIDPGPGARQTFFVGLEEQPVIHADEAGTTLTLVTEHLGSVDAGSPIYYRGILAGEVLGRELGSDRQSVFIQAFVRDPFDQLVRGNSRFWNVSGMDVSMGADGFRVRTASVTSLMFGGIAFDTPDAMEASNEDVADLVFTLHASRDEIEDDAFTKKLRFVMYFDGSVRGLNPGAPVEFRGIRIGEVVDVHLEIDMAAEAFRIPVTVEIEPERLVDRDPDTAVPSEELLSQLVDRGLRGRLATGSLLTGQLFVELNMFPDAPLELVAGPDAQHPELPTIPNTVEAVTATLENVVARIDEVRIDEIAAALQGTLEGARDIANAPELEAALADLGPAMASLRGILGEVENVGVDGTLEAAEGVAENLEETVRLVNQVLQPSAPLQYNVIQMTGELEETARAIRALVEYLERQPQSLVFGRAEDE